MVNFNKEDFKMFINSIENGKVEVKHIGSITITFFINDKMVSSFLIEKIKKVLSLFLKNREDKINFVMYKTNFGRGYDVIFSGSFNFENKTKKIKKLNEKV